MADAHKIPSFSCSNNIRVKLEQAGREMLKTMAESEGVEVLPTGVVLHVLENGPEGPGEGIRPTQASTVKIHYHGTLSDGTVFDSTLGSDPVTFPLAGVIAGWRDGVQKMHEGETAMLGIPPEQAYGNDGTPDGSIPGGSTLFFKIELIEVMSAGIGGGPTLLGVDGNKISRKGDGASALLGADGKPFL
jgi:FKBP-type peptidyl-prolyl cis-trans isomerase